MTEIPSPRRKYMPGGDNITPQIPSGYYTRSMVTAATGISNKTLRRRSKDEIADNPYRPEHFVMFGQTKVWLYAEYQVIRLQAMRRAGTA